jgi:hypothetical protein
MAEKVTICLVGPKKGGKSSLLASLTDCVTQSAYGYSPKLRPALQAISNIEFEATVNFPKRNAFLDSLAGDYDKLRGEFADGGVATDSLDTYDYFFRLTLNGQAPGDIVRKGPWFLRIVDAAGEIAIPPDGDSVAILNDVKDKLTAQLLSAEAIVLVLPLVRLEDSSWIGSVSRLIDRLAQTRSKNLKRLIVAFSQYERLFVPLGPSAFTYACDPEVALHVLRKTLRAAQWMEGLRVLENDEAGVSVRFTVTSAYGFTKRFQNPNIDPHQRGERRFRRSKVEGALGFNEFWRPFLTAEPIIYAALGLDSAFTFSFAQIDRRAFKTHQDETHGFASVNN